MNGYSYQMGALLLDTDDPTRVIGKTNRCLLAPETDYERVGIDERRLVPDYAGIRPKLSGPGEPPPSPPTTSAGRASS